MDKTITRSKEFLFSALFVFIWPFIFCYKYILSQKEYSLMLGNDFGVVYYNYKVYLLHGLSKFHLPLWSPSEASGFPFYSNPLTETFYPLNAILVFFYKINNGYSYADHQKFAVLALSIFGLGLFFWLCSLKIETKFALLSSCIICVSYKFTELLRSPNAAHAAAWIPFVLYGCTIAMENRKKLKAAIVIFVSVIMMVTAGYPYTLYHSLFLFIPYILLILYLRNKNLCFKGADFNFKKYILAIGAAFCSAVLICLPYLIKVRQLLEETSSRNGKSFEFSTEYEFTLSDTIGSLIFPPLAQFEGWYYFGIICLMLIIGSFIYMLLNRSRFKNQLLIWSIVLLWFIIVTYITYGKYSYLFEFLWNYLPGFSGLRVWGRMNIILLPVIAFLLASGSAIFCGMLKKNPHKTFLSEKKNRILIGAIILTGLVIIAAQHYLLKNRIFDEYWTLYFLPYNENFNENIFIVNSIISFVVLIVLVFASGFINKKIFAYIFFGAVSIAAVIDLYPVSSRQWSLNQKPDSTRINLSLDEIDYRSLSKPRVYYPAMISLTPEFFTGYPDNWYYRRYINFLKNNFVDQESYSDDSRFNSFNQLMGLVDGKRVFVSKTIDYKSIPDFISDSKTFEAHNLKDFKIEKYNGEELVCSFESSDEGYLSFIDNWDPDWKVFVNGKEQKIDLLFGTFKSTGIVKGKNVVEFKYLPNIF